MLFSPLSVSALAIAFATLGTSCPTPASENLRVYTSSGLLEGFVDPLTPDVRQFLGVPFSLPPTGSRRWLPPSKFQSAIHIQATDIGPACPQLLVSDTIFKTSVYSDTAGNQTEFFPLQSPNDFSEDCLTLNVWTPRNARQDMPGGFTQGGTNSLYFNPKAWIQRTQEHVVVTVNFRSNIFGFPNAAGLRNQNLGLLDQRLALQWVRDNIASFGGNPGRIVDWGQSAGAIAVDYLDLAYHWDPIVSGRIMDSTTALFTGSSKTTDTTQSNFTAVARAFDCDSLECLRSVSWQDIKAYLADNSALNLTFIPVPDERIVFANTTQRYETGLFSMAPAIIGTNQHESNALGKVLRPLPETLLDAAANQSYLCTGALASRFREAHGRTTYRYLYEGNFSNISPLNSVFAGAYHASELPLIFGTAGDYHGASTMYENEVGEKMQDLWLDFAKDPAFGLENSGWGSFGERKAVVIGRGNTTVMEVDISALDGVCNFSSSE